ncbi:MAG: LamG domain-containing protein [Candidatus Poribacteria bacterium]|nr:LamG domain-containing protein [Candidatus Poribacteria bacterium]
MERFRLTVLGAMVCFSASALALDSDGLIAAFPFDEGKGDIATDISANAHEGVITAGEWVDGPFGMAVEFTGGPSHMAAPGLYASLPNNEITVGAWFYLTTHPAYEGIIGGSQPGKGAVKGECCQYRIMVNPGFSLFINAGGHTDVTVPTIVEPNRWYHYVMTIGDGVVTVYLDGENVHEGVPVNDPLPELDTPFLVGAGESPGTWPLFGYVDEPFIFDRAISAGEVVEIQEKGFVVALAVNPRGKIPAMWGSIKAARQ